MIDPSPRRAPLAVAVACCVVAVAVSLLAPAIAAAVEPADEDRPVRVRKALFLVVDGVYNSELMAPYDVLQHTVFRDDHDYVAPAIVSPDGRAVTTFEGIVVTPHFSFATAPEPDIVVVPSTAGSMDRDLEDESYMEWLKWAVARAEWVITVCDGAFPLAAIGALEGRVATTFPEDRERFRKMFPGVDLRDDVRLAVDGKFITSVGGGMSYEPAFYLVERLFGEEHAATTARGLVWPWSLDDVPHVIRRQRPTPARSGTR